jgi:hypothetical protein
VSNNVKIFAQCLIHIPYIKLTYGDNINTTIFFSSSSDRLKPEIYWGKKSNAEWDIIHFSSWKIVFKCDIINAILNI